MNVRMHLRSIHTNIRASHMKIANLLKQSIRVLVKVKLGFSNGSNDHNLMGNTGLKVNPPNPIAFPKGFQKLWNKL